MSRERATTPIPDVSVIIPAFGRAAALARCFEALASQTLEAERFEVLVCDDGSHRPLPTELAATLRDLGERLRVRIIRQANAGPAAARNTAVAQATGRYLAFTDDDCRPAPNWLERLLHHFASHPNALIGGGMYAAAGSDRYARASQAIMTFVYAEQVRRGGMLLFSTSNLALPARAFRELGGFSPVFKHAAGEDYDLCARWYHNQGEVVYAPDALVAHDHALTFGGFCLQHFRYGRGLLVMRQRSQRRGTRVRRGSLPGTFHLRLIASPIATQGLSGAGAASLIALSQLATALGAVTGLVSKYEVRRAVR